jgi:hypothetical protein
MDPVTKAAEYAKFRLELVELIKEGKFDPFVLKAFDAAINTELPLELRFGMLALATAVVNR